MMESRHDHANMNKGGGLTIGYLYVHVCIYIYIHIALFGEQLFGIVYLQACHDDMFMAVPLVPMDSGNLT